MYDTGKAIIGENRWKEQKVTATSQTNELTSHQKSLYGTTRRSYAYPKLFPWSSSNSVSIDVSSRKEMWSEVIEWTKKGRWRQSQKIAYLVHKKHITTSVAGATPIPRYCRNPHQIPRRLMYDTGKTIGENRSKEQKVMATSQTNELTSHQKSHYGTTRPSNAHSKVLPQCRSNAKLIDVSYM